MIPKWGEYVKDNVTGLIWRIKKYRMNKDYYVIVSLKNKYNRRKVPGSEIRNQYTSLGSNKEIINMLLLKDNERIK